MFLFNLRRTLNENITKLETELERHKLGEAQIWDAAVTSEIDNPEFLIPWDIFKAIESIRVDLRALDAAITPSRYKLLELGFLPARVSALNVAACLGITDAIEELGDSAHLNELAEKLGVSEHKLGK